MKILFSFTLILISCLKTYTQSLQGNWGYSIRGDQITLYGDKIVNQNYGGYSGTLKVALYATKYPYSGGYISGYKLYEMKLESLSAGYSYNNVSNTGYCSYPPKGVYFLTILMLEYNYKYEIIDHISMDGYSTF